ncbi:MAG TPA: ADOP family duplicated permease [Thermoanaerobaculia bacterium]|nr:ADOP family duplicated permease [Thermoanaerobaculia bacterium]
MNPRPRLALRLYDLALLAFPRRLRHRFAPEMRADLERLYERRHGRPARLALMLHALFDVLRAALRERLGNSHDRYRVAQRSRGGETMWTSGLGGDLRAAIRSLARAPVFTACGALVLALGIGANGAAFSTLRATVLAEPAFPHVERLAVVDLTVRDGGGTLQVSGGVPAPDWDEPQRLPWSYPKFQELLRSPENPFEATVGYTSREGTLSSHGEPERVRIEIVSPGYFELLGVRPDLGATLPHEPTAEPAIVLSRGLFDSRYGGAADLIGAPVQIDGKPVVVAGVAPAGFQGLTGRAQAWLTFESVGLVANPRLLTWEQAHWFFVLGRLPVEGTFDDARPAMHRIGDHIASTLVDEEVGSATWSADLRPLLEARRNPNAGRAVMVLTVASLLVLVIACANLAALQLARASSRVREVAVRRALGAARWRLVRSLGMESLLLGLLGGALGLLLYVPARSGFSALWPEAFQAGEAGLFYADAGSLQVGLAGFVFHFAVAVVAGLAFGVVPALWVSGRRAGSLARAAAAAGATGPRGSWLREGLVAAQVALAVVFLVAAGLLVRSLFELRSVPVGFDPRGLLTIKYQLPRESAWVADAAGFHERFRERVEALPGVESASLGLAPLGGHWWITGVREISGRPPLAHSERPDIGVDSVSDGHFRTLGVPLLAGRTFGAQDRADSPPALVINETAARKLFDGIGPDAVVGRRLGLGIGLTPEGSTAEVIGVVGDVLYNHPAEGVIAEAYVSQRQQPDGQASLVVRATGDALDQVPAIRSELAAMDPALALAAVSTVESLGLDALGDTRALAALLLGFAGVALLLAMAGTYGVVASWAVQRDRELGIRLALGAGIGQLERMVLRRGVATAAAGVLLGLVAAAFVARGVEAFLFNVRPADPSTLAAAAGFLSVVAVVASYLPARRVTRIDPVEALRAE